MTHPDKSESYAVRDEIKRHCSDLDISLCLANHKPDHAVQLAAVDLVLAVKRLSIVIGFDLDAAIAARAVPAASWSKEQGFGEIE